MFTSIMSAGTSLAITATTMAVGETTGGTGFLGAVTDALAIVAKGFDFVVGNPLLMIYIGAGLLCLGFTVFKKGKKVVK